MTPSELASLMLDWEGMQKRADELRAKIVEEVLSVGKTQTVGNVRASYSSGRKNYDYAGSIMAMERDGTLAPDALDPYTEIIPATTKVDFRAACVGLGIEDIPFTQSPPSVTLKLMG
jgi:hypothetical protein